MIIPEETAIALAVLGLILIGALVGYSYGWSNGFNAGLDSAATDVPPTLEKKPAKENIDDPED